MIAWTNLICKQKIKYIFHNIFKIYYRLFNEFGDFLKIWKHNNTIKNSIPKYKCDNLPWPGIYEKYLKTSFS